MITAEEVKTYLKVKDELYGLCEKWAKHNLEDWKHFSGFNINENTITIKYTYQDYCNNMELDSIKVPLKEILK